MPCRPSLVVVALAAALLVGACSAAASPSTTASYPPGAVVISANGLRFSTDQLVVPAGASFTLVFENKESVPHNVVITSKPEGKGDVVFRHDPITGTTQTFTVPAIARGTYYFHCDVHPTMTGTVLAQ